MKRPIIVDGSNMYVWRREIFDIIGWPEEIHFGKFAEAIEENYEMTLAQAKSSAPKALSSAGYERIVNTAREDGRWKVDGKMIVIYRKKNPD